VAHASGAGQSPGLSHGVFFSDAGWQTASCPLSMHDPPTLQSAEVTHCLRHLPRAHLRGGAQSLLSVHAFAAMALDPAFELPHAGANSAIPKPRARTRNPARCKARDAALLVEAL
jgi:hypothetical protein